MRSAPGEPRKIPTEILYASGEGSLIFAEAPADAPEKKPTLSMTAYSGGPMDLGWYGTTYVDLAGMDMPERVPILRQHDGGKVVGLSRAIDKADAGPLKIEIDTHKTAHADEVIQLARDGFPWQASIGFRVKAEKDEDIEFLEDEDETAEVNGRTVAGPCMIARRSVLKEASVVPIGADPETTVTASSDFNPKRSTKKMADPAPTPTPDKKKATLAELKAAFPKDREFALDQCEKGATLAEAKAEYSDILAARLEELEKKTPAAPAVPARMPRTPVAIAAGSGGGAKSASTVYHELVRAEQAAGKSLAVARREVAIHYPEVHAGLIVEANGGHEWKPFPPAPK